MHTQPVEWEQWAEYDALVSRLRDREVEHDYSFRNGILLGFVGGGLLYAGIYAVWTLATWVMR